MVNPVSETLIIERMRKALRTMGDTHTLEDVIEAVRRGDMQVFHNDDAIIVTELSQSPRKRYLHVFLAAGRLEGLAELKPQMLKWGLSHGAEFALAAVRPGLEKYLKGLGWQRHKILMRYKPEGNEYGRL